MTQGVGLGLSTTKLLTEVQGGSVTVESIVDVFTQVNVKIRVEIEKNIIDG